MEVWVLCVVMRDRDPFEIGSEIVLHLSSQIARQPLQINPVAELRRKYYLPDSLVPCRLPAFEFADNVEAVQIMVKPRLDCLGINRALAGQIAPVGSPLTARTIIEICHPNRAAVIVGTAKPTRALCAGIANEVSTRPCVVHEQPVATGPGGTLAPCHRRLAGANPNWPVVIFQNHGSVGLSSLRTSHLTLPRPRI
jgi:hypothetical protein